MRNWRISVCARAPYGASYIHWRCQLEKREKKKASISADNLFAMNSNVWVY